MGGRAESARSWELLEGTFCPGQWGTTEGFGAGGGYDQLCLCVVGFAAGGTPSQGYCHPLPSPHQGPLTSGTSCPFSMISDSFLPLAEPELTSARRRSPVERWV